MMHTNIPKNDWTKIKGEIQKTWSSLSGDDLEKTHGDVSAISGLVQKKYGLKKEDAERRLDEVIERTSSSSERGGSERGGSERSGESRDSRESRGGSDSSGRSERR